MKRRENLREMATPTPRVEIIPADPEEDRTLEFLRQWIADARARRAAREREQDAA